MPAEFPRPPRGPPARVARGGDRGRKVVAGSPSMTVTGLGGGDLPLGWQSGGASLPRVGCSPLAGHYFLRPYTMTFPENEATYTLPLATTGGLNFA
jgi:hypothetical protein